MTSVDRTNRYQRAYVDFFEDQMVGLSYDWKALVHHYLFKADVPLIYGIMGHGEPNLSSLCRNAYSVDGDPLIQLAFALEISSQTLAIESLARACCEYSPAFVLENSGQSSSRADTDTILAEMRKENELNKVKASNIPNLLENYGAKMAEYAWKWDIDDQKSFESELAKACMYAAALSSQSKIPAVFDEVVKSAYALRVILSLQDDPKTQHSLAQQWFMLFISAYVLAGMPTTTHDHSSKGGQSWTSDIKNPVIEAGSTTPSDAFGVIRALEGLSSMKNENSIELLSTAVQFVRNRGIVA
jgi:hypothetical protein